MEYRRFGNTIILRLDPGEEVCSSLLDLAAEEEVKLGTITGLGAVKEFVTGVFDTEDKKYYANTFKGKYEITSLTGTLTCQDGNPYLHVHMSAGDSKGSVYGGHLNKAVVSATAEIVISIFSGAVERKFSEEIGLNLMKF